MESFNARLDVLNARLQTLECLRAKVEHPEAVRAAAEREAILLGSLRLRVFYTGEWFVRDIASGIVNRRAVHFSSNTDRRYPELRGTTGKRSADLAQTPWSEHAWPPQGALEVSNLHAVVVAAEMAM